MWKEWEMDESNEYAKMCNCNVIQLQENVIYSDCEFYNGYLYGEDKDYVHVWLPRQDQLQAMFGARLWKMICRPLDIAPSISLLTKDYVACLLPEIQNKTTYCYGSTPEQALLELVMITLHNKKWNGEAWNK